MKRGQAFPSNFASKEDCPRVVTIDNVDLQEIQGDGGKENKPVMHFSDFDKPLILNNINWMTIESEYGDDSDLWRGKRIEIYHDPNVMFGTKRVGGVRIRIPANNGTKANGEVWSFDQAVTNCAAAGISKERLIESLKNAGKTGWSPQRDTQHALDMIEAKAAEEAFAGIPSANEEASFG